MEHIEIDEVETGGFGRDAEMRPLTDALGTEDMAINHYRLDPGEGFSGGLHAHLDQEEVFVILSGTATFETESDAVEVGAGEAIRFAPGEYQTGSNDGEEPVEALRPTRRRCASRRSAANVDTTRSRRFRGTTAWSSSVPSAEPRRTSRRSCRRSPPFGTVSDRWRPVAL